MVKMIEKINTADSGVLEAEENPVNEEALPNT
jgi:hypothetical protein